MSSTSQPSQTRAKEIFSNASPELQELIRKVLQEEREVQHMQTRANIHTRLYEHIRYIIK